MTSLMSNPVPNTDRTSRRKRKKKSLGVTLHQSQNDTNNQNQNQMISNQKWRTSMEEKSYTYKLIQALRHVRTDPSSSASSSSIPKRGRAVKEAADRVLAMSAKGKTRWSRAILTNRLKLKFLRARKAKVVYAARNNRASKKSADLCRKVKNLPAVQKKARMLGNLVPGCRKQSLPVILKETHDYISALEMQVRAMAALAELLTVAGALSGTNPPPRPPAP